MRISEILEYNPDVICLQVGLISFSLSMNLMRANAQEVDRLEKLLPSLHSASYAETYAAGPGKRHGCMIVYRDAVFEKIEQETIYYDDLDVRPAGDKHERKGSSRRTKNIGLIVGIRRRDQPDHGYVIATTHLFWHPS
jgi:RNA exonuclease NGL2